MAGTLIISTLSDGTNSTSSTNAIQGSAKAWVNYNGSTQTIRGSYNVSSVTRSATGIYRVNMTNAMVDANYAVVVSLKGGNTNNDPQCSIGNANQADPDVSSFSVSTINGSTNYDVPYVLAAVFR